jgi:hypothetical protein
MPFTERIKGGFYSIDKVVSRHLIGSLNPNRLYMTGIFEQDEVHYHMKDVYTLIDCLGDLGGLIEIVMFVTGILLAPISYHSYILKAISRLFTARTKNSNLFKPPKTVLKGDSLNK